VTFNPQTTILTNPNLNVVTLVLTTPTSGPALMCTPQCDSRQMLLPTVLVMPTIRAPRRRQYRSASRVSAVSPGMKTSRQTTRNVFIVKENIRVTYVHYKLFCQLIVQNSAIMPFWWLRPNRMIYCQQSWYQRCCLHSNVNWKLSYFTLDISRWLSNWLRWGFTRGVQKVRKMI